MNATLFTQQALLFLQKIDKELKINTIDIEPHWNVDHLCYRVATSSEYDERKQDFLQFSKLLTENTVNGRLISVFKLFEPLQFLKWNIDVVELPSPKKGTSTATGFEHIEVVVDQPFSNLIKKFSHTTIDTAALTKTWNAELRIKFSDCSIKFHQLSLESVVRLETNKPVHTAIQNLGVLSDFSKFEPLIAGTFPLGIFTQSSDVDVLMSSQNLEELKILLIKKYSHLTGFQAQDSVVKGESTIVVNFVFENIPFEIFAQKTPSIRQHAYLHFLIEERLLKLGGQAFTAKLRDLRTKGIKTEPAFAQAIHLRGDPYAALLDLQSAPECSLLRIVSF